MKFVFICKKKLSIHKNCFIDTFPLNIPTGYVVVHITHASFKLILEENCTVPYSLKCSSSVRKPKVIQIQHRSRINKYPIYPLCSKVH